MDLMRKRVCELRQMCRDRQIPGFSTRKKCDLVSMLTNPVSFTDEECHRSATEWFGETSSPARSWFYNALIDPKQHRDIGKVLAYFAEERVKDYIMMKTGRPIISVYGEPYDGMTADDGPRIRHQVKFRKGDLCLDPFAGSGTLGRACLNLKRQFMLFDINPEAKTAFEKTIATNT